MTTKFRQNEVNIKMTNEEFDILVFIVNQIRMNADFTQNHYQSEVSLSEQESDIFNEMVF